MLDQSAIDLMLSLVAMFVATGKVAMPPGRREDAVALLADLMAAGDRFREYVELLTAELKRRGVWLKLLEGPAREIPGEQIAREGFANVPDESLADIALSPQALGAIREHLDDPESDDVGDWHIRAILAAERSRPPDPEGDERARRALQEAIGRPVGDCVEF